MSTIRRFEGRNVVVTGAGQGIGRAIADRFAAEGADLMLIGRRREPLEQVAQEIAAAGGSAWTHAADVSDAAAVDAAVAAALERWERIDVLVNNAGIAEERAFLEIEDEGWDRILATNLRGAFLMCRQVVPSMIKKRWGRIVNVGSVVGLMGNAGQANYAASKAGLTGLTKALARELASRNVTVNTVAPGYIETDMTAELPEESKKRLFELIPLARFGAPADVAAAVLFLASEAAGYITGQILNVNGGMYM